MQITKNIPLPPADPTVPVITYSDNDYGPILQNHDDPLLTATMIRNTEVRRVFMDQGSPVDILLYDAFKKMKFREGQLSPADTGLMRFTGDGLVSKGYVEKQITLGTNSLTRTENVMFALLTFQARTTSFWGGRRSTLLGRLYRRPIWS